MFPSKILSQLTNCNWLSGLALWAVIGAWGSCGVWGWLQIQSGLFAAVVIARGARLWGRVVWGSFVWGDGPGIIVWGPPAFGSAEARWGAFAWGVFC